MTRESKRRDDLIMSRWVKRCLDFHDELETKWKPLFAAAEATEPEQQSYVDDEGMPTEKAVLRRQLKSARDVVEAARPCVKKDQDGAWIIITQDHYWISRLDRLDQALKRHDEGGKDD